MLASAALARTPRAAEIRARHSAPVRFQDLGALTDPSPSPIHGYHLLPPPPDAAPSIDAATAAQHVSSRGAGERTPTVAFAILAAWPDHVDRGLAGRLVYVVRRDDVRWITSGPAPGPCERPRDHSAIGTQTAVVDAHTGTTLVTKLTGTTAEHGHSAAAGASRRQIPKLAPLWANRPHVDDRFIVKADALLNRLALDLALARSTAPDVETLRPRVEQIGTRFAQFVSHIAQANGSVLGGREVDELVAECRRIADSSTSTAGSLRVSIAAQIERVLRTNLQG